MRRIDPQPASGFSDLLPKELAVRQEMIDSVRASFARNGFSFISTPALEREEVLTGGDPLFAKQIYRAKITEDDAPLGLRFDLTVPLARFVAAHADDLVFPFSVSHIGPVWRGEHTQAGRWRQFIQCDADIVGATELTADAQILALVYSTLSDLGLSDRIAIRISNRKILGGLPEFFNFDQKLLPQVLRAIDKLEKQPWKEIADELKSLGLDSSAIDGIQELLSIRASDPIELLDQADKYLKFAPQSHEGIQELRELSGYLDALNVPRTTWSFDLSIARGLGYYTGMVYETSLVALPRIGSVSSGGRYDELVSRFAPLRIAGVGMSIGIDRLRVALDELGIARTPNIGAAVGVLNFDESCKLVVLRLASDLRNAGISTALYTGTDNSLKGQLSWALRSQFKIALLVGPQEKDRNVVQIKQLEARTQDEVPLAQIIGKCRELVCSD